MGLCEDAPDEYCGHVLEPEDAGFNGEADDAWHERTRNAVCLREPTYDGLCVWHADTDEKTAEELVESRLTPEEVPWEAEYVKEHLNGAILWGIEFPEEFSFGGCALVSAEFSDAYLPDAEFSDAYAPFAEFPDADLTFTEFSRAYLGGVKFFDANLRRAEFPHADLEGAEFSDADLPDAEFPDADLFQAEFPDADLAYAEFPHAYLGGAEFPCADLRGAEFPGADLYKAEFPGSDLYEAEFPDADLTDAEFPDADLRCAEFPCADLRGAEFPDADLERAEFSGADLREAAFEPPRAREEQPESNSAENSLGASLEDAQFEDETDLRGADLSGARLYQTAFRDVRINDDTTFGIDDDGKPGKACRYEYDPNTGVSINEDEPRLRAAAWTHRRLESLFEENAMDQRARNAHIRKEEAQRTNHKQRVANDDLSREDRLTSLGQYAVSTLNWHLHRHGESLRRLLGVSILLILGCGVLYPFVGGINSGQSGGPYRITSLTEFVGVDGWIDVANGIYFSAITFTTIGYGDFYPAGTGSRVLVALESLAGALLIALFVFVIGRRVAR